MQQQKCPHSDSDKQDVQVLQDLTPFDAQELQGQRFARGNMLGGSNPLEAADPAPWENQTASDGE